jgi:hypothetical protein
MSQAVPTSGKQHNFWWGLGVSVDSQAITLGVSAMLSRMFAFPDEGAKCVIRVSGVQVGPGLGGGDDTVLVIATGIAGPPQFNSARLDGGWNFSLRDFFSATSTPKSCFKLAQLIRTVPTKEILDFTIAHPAYIGVLKDTVGLFYDSVIVGANAARPGRGYGYSRCSASALSSASPTASATAWN